MIKEFGTFFQPVCEAEAIHLTSGGKINFFLRIHGVRPDGYHELSTLFFPLSEPQDELIIRRGPEGSCLTVHCAMAGIDPLHNTLTEAYARFVRATGYAPALDVELIKGIPHGAGLGGGSADAALLLNWLRTNAPCVLGAEAWISLAASVGADVPFFLEQKPCLAEGIGEQLTPCGPEWITWLKNIFIVLLCPDVRVNTVCAYSAWDAAKKMTDQEGVGALTAADKPDKNHRSSFFWPLCVENDFEPVVFATQPELARFKVRLVREGAVAAGLSGSGSALFGLFRDKDVADAAADRLRKEGPLAGFTVYGSFFLSE